MITITVIVPRRWAILQCVHSINMPSVRPLYRWWRRQQAGLGAWALLLDACGYGGTATRLDGSLRGGLSRRRPTIITADRLYCPSTEVGHLDC
jgi:hypothetical protein